MLFALLYFSLLQGHWRFPGGKEMQGYAYILTHPGTPAVFFDHIFSHYKSEIGALISIRNRNKIQCRSTVSVNRWLQLLGIIMCMENSLKKIRSSNFLVKYKRTEE